MPVPVTIAEGTIESVIEVGDINNIDQVNTVIQILTLDTVSTVEAIADVDNVNTVDVLNTVVTVDLVTAITDIDNVNSVAWIDVVDSVTMVDNVNSVDLVDAVTNVDVVNAVTDVNNVNSVDLVDLVTAVTDVDNVNSVDLVDSVTSVDSVAELVKTSDGSITIATGNTGTANTAVQLPTVAANKFVVVRSRDDNDTDQPIWVGNASVDAANSANGYPLDAGEVLQLPVENANMLYVDSQVADQNYSLIIV